MKIFKKILAGILIANIIISLNAPVAMAGFRLPSPTKILTEMLTGPLGLNPGELKKIFKPANTLSYKKNPPAVSLIFTPTNPVAGEKITATASPSRFLNDPTKLYYTWFLKHNTDDGIKKRDDKTLGKNIDCDGDGNCDLNNDADIDIEDYKIEAMRILANGGFEWTAATYKENTDNDSYDAAFGGDDQKGKEKHCFFQKIDTGSEYEIDCNHLFPSAPDQETGDAKFGIEEERFWNTDPTTNDTAGTGTVDEATIAGLGKNSFSWNYTPGDKIGIVVEGASTDASPYKDSSVKTMWAMPNPNECKPEIKSKDGVQSSSSTSSQSITYDTNGYKIVVITTIDLSYADGELTTDTIGVQGLSTIETKKVSIKTDTYAPIMNPPSSGYVFTSNGSSLPPTWEKPIDNSTIPPTTFPSQPVTYATTPTTSATDIPKWIDANNAPTTVDPQTSDPGASDAFTQTTFYNPSEKTLSDLRKDFTGKPNLNNCLEDQLIAPSEGNSNQKLEINLSYLPKILTNTADESATDADVLTIQSDIANSENPSFLKYDWQFSIGSKVSGDNWKELTKTELTEQTGLQKTLGLGLQDINLNVAFTNSFLDEKLSDIEGNTFYIKASLYASEGAGNQQKTGRAHILIPVYLSTNTIKLFSTNISDDSFISLSIAEEKCKEGLEQLSCPVIQNEIIGARFDLGNTSQNKLDDMDFLWTLNKEPLSPNSLSAENPHIVYIPILKETDAKYELTLTATNKKTGENIILTRDIKVINPEITVKSSDYDKCKPLILGNYIDLNGNKHPDYSPVSFEALQGETVQLTPLSNTALSTENISWFFDGIPVTNTNFEELGIKELRDDGTLIFSADKPLGKTYNISLETIYTQPVAVKKALQEKWSVPLTAFYEKPLRKSIEIKTVAFLGGSDVAAAKKIPQKALASLFAAMPAYINFLFRVALTIFLILFSTGLLFSLFPKQTREQ